MNLLRTVYAQAQVPTTVGDPLGNQYTNLASVFGVIINIVIGVGIALTVVFLVLAGIQYITARGDAKAADAARGALTNAIIGFIIVLAAVTIRYLVGGIIGSDNVTGVNNVVPF